MRWIVIPALLLAACSAAEHAPVETAKDSVSAQQYNSCVEALRSAVEATYSEVLADARVSGIPSVADFMDRVTRGRPFGEPIAADETIQNLNAMKQLRLSITAARGVYSEVVDDATSRGGQVVEGERWRGVGLPLPATFTRYVAERVPPATGFRFRLRSLYPLNPQSGPADSRERAAMEAVQASTTGAEYYRQLGDTTHLWVFPDVAHVESCADCHNNHPDRQASYPEFQLGSVVGALVTYLEVDGG